MISQEDYKNVNIHNIYLARLAESRLKIARRLRSEMLAIAADALANKIPQTTSSTTGLAGRIKRILDEVEQEEYAHELRH